MANLMNPKSFFGELKRRNVYKVAVAYAIVGWLLVQIATQVFPFLEIPNWVVRLVIGLVLVVLFAAICLVIVLGSMRSRAFRPSADDWAPVEAAVGHKFLGRTVRSHRRWVTDAAGRKRLIEATREHAIYRISLDGETVETCATKEAAGTAMNDAERRLDSAT